MLVIKRILSVTLPDAVREACYSFMDWLDLLFRRRDALTPPMRKIFVGEGVFKEIGEEFFRYFVDIGGLKPNEKIADIGCGIGRMAVPLTGYLAPEGSYEGLDIVPDGIRWCKKNITPRYPNFHFQLADVFNGKYHPGGKQKAFAYRFPYRDESFDFVALASVFTHMLPPDMENYFHEIARVLKRNGRCLITFFLLNEESSGLIREKTTGLHFKHALDEHCRFLNPAEPEETVAYDEKYIRSLYEKNGLKITQPVHCGWWCGRGKFLSFQDAVMAVKES